MARTGSLSRVGYQAVFKERPTDLNKKNLLTGREDSHQTDLMSNLARHQLKGAEEEDEEEGEGGGANTITSPEMLHTEIFRNRSIRVLSQSIHPLIKIEDEVITHGGEVDQRGVRGEEMILLDSGTYLDNLN